MSKSALNRIIAVAVLAVISVAAILIFKSRIVVSPPSYPKDTEENYTPDVTTEKPDETKTPDTETGTPDTQEDPDDYNPYILKETPAASTDYLERLVYIGDRTIGKMTDYAITELPYLTRQVWSFQDNASLARAINSESFLYLDMGEYVSFSTAIKNYMPAYAVLTFGSFTDDPDVEYTKEDFLSSYGELIASLSAASPNTQFIIQSILPVGEGCPVITPDQIKERNEWLKEFCFINGIFYLDSYSVLANPNGNLFVEYYDPDNIADDIQGYTMNDVGYRKMIEYLLTHTHPSYVPAIEE